MSVYKESSLLGNKKITNNMKEEESYNELIKPLKHFYVRLPPDLDPETAESSPAALGRLVGSVTREGNHPLPVSLAGQCADQLLH